VLKVLAAVFALIAVALLSLAMIGMATHRFSARVGWVLRITALGCFALTVILNTAAH
jgi:hypothetical protein